MVAAKDPLLRTGFGKSFINGQHGLPTLDDGPHAVTNYLN